MAEVIKMPRLSDTMEEGVVAQWLKKVGYKVSEGDILAEIETDKATMEFESFSEGVLLHIGIKEGETAPVDSLLAILGNKGEDISKLIQINDDINDEDNNEKIAEPKIKLEKKVEDSKKQQKEDKKQPKKTKSKQHKLRKIDLSEIKSQIGTVNRKPVAKSDEDEPATRSAKDAVKQTLASMDKKSKKKVYKKGPKPDQEEELNEDDVVKLKIPEYSSVDELAKLMDVDASDIIKECISLGKLATINQRLDWEVIEMLAETFGYEA